jgi:pimeloyl-ACP methyl ester carboxylesterase
VTTDHGTGERSLGDHGRTPVDEAVLLDAALPDLDWTAVPPGAARGWFDAPSGRLATLSMGDPSGQHVVLAPGVTGSKEDFVLMLPLLAAAGYFAIGYDLAGQYQSHDAGPPAGRRYDHALFVDDLLALLASAPAPSHVLGYSFAGTVAQLAYVAQPSAFASLTLLSTPPVPGQVYLAMRRHGWASRISSSRLGAWILITGVRNNYTRVPPGRLQFVRDRFALTSVASVRDIIGLMRHTPDLRSELAAAAIPKLIAVGEHDLWPLAAHAAFAERIHARLAVYRTGHSPCETTPHQLVRDLLALFDRSSAA